MHGIVIMVFPLIGIFAMIATLFHSDCTAAGYVRTFHGTEHTGLCPECCVTVEQLIDFKS